MTSIPKILHQIWIGPYPAPTNLMRTWKEKHPDFEYILWNEEEIQRRRLSLECFRQFDMMGELAGKADILRWEILWHYGGYFVDADSICIEPFDEFFENKVAFATYENENVRTGLVANGTMGFVPKYRMLRDIIDWIKGTSEAAKLIKETRAWYSVGPALLTKMLETGKYADFSVYPSYTFLPIHFTGVSYTGHKKVYAHQEWGTAKSSHATLNSVTLPSELMISPSDKWYSVLITSYNTDPIYMKECLDSIRNQTGHFGIEVVWVDDGSSKENSKHIMRLLEHFRKNSRFTRYIYRKTEENQGPAKASNIGLEICSNEIIFKMDSDDIMMPDRMERQIEFIKENPKVVLCGANMRLFSIDSTNTKRVVNSTSHPYTMSWETLYHSKTPWYMNNPTLCYKKSAILSVGGYRTDDPRILYLSEDYDLLTRVLKKYGSVYCMPDILLMYRLHPGQLTHRLNENSAEHIQLLHDCIENANK
jgi:mannosyltransferase OCH1-like enzyme